MPPPVTVHLPTPADPTLCTGCGAIYSHKVWRWAEGPFDERLEVAARALCPACRQVRDGTYFGLVSAVGDFDTEEEEGLLARIQAVARRAGHTQPERRIVSVRRLEPGLEVRTTSEKLAHRIARELVKAFGGEATYRWSEHEGALRAVWTSPHHATTR
jgi:NMD protein affecting ribosome stability and mRNA decay